MGVWDITTPAGTDPRSQGDDRIREMKSALQEALRGGLDEGDEAVFPGSAASTAPIFKYRGRKGTTAQRPTAGQNGLYFDTDRQVIQRDNGSAWEDIATNIPLGTKAVFFQAAAPTGWSKDTTHNGKALRVVSGTGGGNGGSQDIATAISLAHSHTVNSHTHDMSNHTHSTPNHQHDLDHDLVTLAPPASPGTGNQVLTNNSSGDTMVLSTSGSSPLTSRRRLKNRTQNSGSGTSGGPDTNTTGASAPGTNSALSNVSLAYVDVLICTKS